MVGTLAIVVGLLWLVVWQITRQWSSVQARTVEAIEQFRQYLIDGPLHLTEAQIDDLLAQALNLHPGAGGAAAGRARSRSAPRSATSPSARCSRSSSCCASSPTAAASGAGRRGSSRTSARPAVDGAARAGWVTVVNYARTQLLVATIDAIGIGLGAFLLGVPLAIPIAVLVFLGAFVPIVGAVVTGALAVFLALVYNGPWIALWMLVVVLGVQQIEGHVLQPLLMGSAVKVHPLAVVLVVAGGAMIAGIPGALFAVPLAAFVNVVAVYLGNRAWETGARPPTDDLIWTTVPRPRRVRT